MRCSDDNNIRSQNSAIPVQLGNNVPYWCTKP
jgi:hypothetical protein